MAHCEHVPSMPFTPNMSKGYRSDTNANAYPQLGPIRFGGICLTDIMQNGSRRIPGAQDEVFGQAPYGIIKLYLTVRSWMAALSHLLDCYLLFFILFRSGPDTEATSSPLTFTQRGCVPPAALSLSRPRRCSAGISRCVRRRPHFVLFCKELSVFLQNCRMSGMQPAAAKWRIGAGGLTIHNILFNKLVNTFENVWQIDCDIIV